MKLLKYLPNFLTLTRIFSVPIAVRFLFDRKFYFAFGLFAFLAFTDCLDGYLARKLDAQTKIGSFLDPIADKFTVILLYTALMILGNCPPWFLGLVISVTVFQGLGLSWIETLSIRRKMKFAPLWIGKFNMGLQLIWLGWLLFRLALLQGKNIGYISWPESIFYISLAIIQIIVFLTYFFHYRVHLTPEIKTFFPLRSTPSRY